MSSLDRERLVRAMEELTGQDADISVLWWPDAPRSAHGQGTQREFVDRLMDIYERPKCATCSDTGLVDDFTKDDSTMTITWNKKLCPNGCLAPAWYFASIP